MWILWEQKSFSKTKLKNFWFDIRASIDWPAITYHLQDMHILKNLTKITNLKKERRSYISIIPQKTKNITDGTWKSLDWTSLYKFCSTQSHFPCYSICETRKRTLREMVGCDVADKYFLWIFPRESIVFHHSSARQQSVFKLQFFKADYGLEVHLDPHAEFINCYGYFHCKLSLKNRWCWIAWRHHWFNETHIRSSCCIVCDISRVFYSVQSYFKRWRGLLKIWFRRWLAGF